MSKPKRKSKARRRQEEHNQITLRVLNQPVPTVDENGKASEKPAFEAILEQCAEAATRGDMRAASILQHVQRIVTSEASKARDPKSGVVVVHRAMTEQEWEKKTRHATLTLNPLEGIPGAEGYADQIDRETNEEEDDPTGN